MIEIKDLTHRFGKQLLFENVNLSLDRSHRYGLIGANGAGKSTFLKILSGEVEHTSGEIAVDSGLKIGVLGQDQFAFEDFSLKDAVLYGNKRLYEAVKEKEKLYESAEFIGFVNSHTLKAKNFVGLIQTKSGFVLEILPKIFEKDEEFDGKKSQDLLFKMLKTLKNSPFKHTQMANLKAKNLPLLEIFANMFLDELDIIIKSGIKNNYVEISQNRHFLKGKLLFNEHLKANLIHKERFYTNADEFIANIPKIALS